MSEHREGPVEVHPFILGALSRAHEAGIGVDCSDEARKSAPRPQSTGVFIGRVLTGINTALSRKGIHSRNVEIGLATMEEVESDAPASLYSVLGIDQIRETHIGQATGSLAEALEHGVCIPDLTDELGCVVIRGYSLPVNSHAIATYYLRYPDAPKSRAMSMIELAQRIEEEQQARTVGQVSVGGLG